MTRTPALSEAEKILVKTAIPPPGNKILTAAPASIYFASPDPDSWTYGGLQGALALVEDSSTHVFSLKLVDILDGANVIWKHELDEAFEYHQDKPSFHSFAGNVGLLFFDGLCHAQLVSSRNTRLA